MTRHDRAQEPPRTLSTFRYGRDIIKMRRLFSSQDDTQPAIESTRRELFRFTATGLAALALPVEAIAQPALQGGELPTSGAANPKLAKYDEVMANFMRELKVPGAALGVTRAGRLVYARGFGYADVESRHPVQPTSLFRIASISKPFTSAAVFRLIDEGKLKLGDKVFSLVKLTPHLSPGKRIDPRIATITVRHCLQHTAGWDRDKGFDPMSANAAEETAKALGLSLPVSRQDIIRYTLGRPLDFNPGSRFAYSNFGYVVLGRLIEAVSKARYEAFVIKEVLNPLGIKAMRLGKNFLMDRAPDEVKYYDSKHPTRRAFSGPQIGKEVPLPYDGGLEPMDACGGWIASAVDLLRFAATLDDPSHCRILKADNVRTMLGRPEGAAGHEKNGDRKAVYYASGWHVRPVKEKPGQLSRFHNGGLDGTESYLFCRSDKTDWAILFNTDGNSVGRSLAMTIEPLLNKATDEIKNWPDEDLFPHFYPPR